MDTRAYLDRIGYAGPADPTPETLRGLHAANLLTVPFENLDIPLGVPITLDADALFDKIVTRRRGGFCYELNGLFARLLAALGFRVTLMEARDVQPDGALGPPFDHLTLKVTCPAHKPTERSNTSAANTAVGASGGSAVPWLADVGWGDSFRSPLRLDLAEAMQPDGDRSYRIVWAESGHVLYQREPFGAWEPQYQFVLRPRVIGDFAATCRYHQTSPDSHFTRKVIVTRATPAGRVTLSGLRLIETHNSVRTEQDVAPGDYLGLLQQHFGIALERSPFDV
jgi:N-hydroxyarylamine O-acetyltransferase